MWRPGSGRSRFCPYSIIQAQQRAAVGVAEVTNSIADGGKMNHERTKTDGKKPYEPPLLTTISLRPEEAVLSHCKTGTGGGGMMGNCHAHNCMTLGS